MKIVKPSVELVWITPDPERMIEQIGRTCYKSEDRITVRSHGPFIKMLISRGHDAMIEHASASFWIMTDRGITHEIVRHRIASYAQESTRYCNYGKGKFGSECTFIEPPDLPPHAREEWYDLCIAAEGAYLRMLEEGARPELARSVLPTSLKAEIVMTANFREWRHFISLRAAPTAHPQVRPLAIEICRELHKHAPNVFGDLFEQFCEQKS